MWFCESHAFSLGSRYKGGSAKTPSVDESRTRDGEESVRTGMK